MPEMDIGLSQQPAISKKEAGQSRQCGTVTAFDEALDEASFRVVSLQVLGDLGNFRREMAEHDNS